MQNARVLNIREPFISQLRSSLFILASVSFRVSPRHFKMYYTYRRWDKINFEFNINVNINTNL